MKLKEYEVWDGDMLLEKGNRVGTYHDIGTLFALMFDSSTRAVFKRTETGFSWELDVAKDEVPPTFLDSVLEYERIKDARDRGLAAMSAKERKIEALNAAIRATADYVAAAEDEEREKGAETVEDFEEPDAQVMKDDPFCIDADGNELGKADFERNMALNCNKYYEKRGDDK